MRAVLLLVGFLGRRQMGCGWMGEFLCVCVHEQATPCAKIQRQDFVCGN